MNVKNSLEVFVEILYGNGTSFMQDMAVAKSLDKPGYVMLSGAKHLYCGVSETLRSLKTAPSG